MLTDLKYISVDINGARSSQLNLAGLLQRSNSSTLRFQTDQPRNSARFKINYQVFKAEYLDEDKPRHKYIYSLCKKEKIHLPN